MTLTAPRRDLPERYNHWKNTLACLNWVQSGFFKAIVKLRDTPWNEKKIPFFPILDRCFVNIGDMIAAKEKEIGMIAKIIDFVSSLNTTWLVKKMSLTI